LVGIDPTGEKFRNYYKPYINLVTDFFSAGLVTRLFPGKKAKVITSFSMLYDLEDPLAFARDIASILDSESGLWIFEQSYMPLMLERIAFDTVCHEHLEYYGLKQIVWLADRAGLKIIDVELNNVNGGSFSVVAALKDSIHKQAQQLVQDMLDKEDSLGLSTLRPYQDFSVNTDAACRELKTFIADARKNGKRVCALGASTKGNVLLQYCGITSNDIEVIGEVNEDKFGCLTPGSWIPIDDESQVLESKPDYLIVLPWHFKEFFLMNSSFKGQRLVFPLPSLEVVSL
jgi:NDP-4-keto-2,6-dideoxyhexose 3-C-methyltransferase